MLQIASTFSNIEFMSSNIHHVSKYAVMDDTLEWKEPWVIAGEVLSVQAHQTGDLRESEEWAAPLAAI